MEIFATAARLKIRFETPRGALSVEDLWDLPLTSGTGKPNLDDLARVAHRELRSATESVTFVDRPAPGASELLQLRFDVVKYVIDAKISERDAAANAAKKKEVKEKILAIVAEKQDADLRSKSVEELTAMLAGL